MSPARVRQAQDFLERPLILENPSSYVRFAHSTMEEPEFLRRLAEATGCGLLLDVNNVYVSCFNAGTDPVAYIDAFPCESVVQMHLAGHQHRGTHIIDTHDRPVRPEVWDLFRSGLGPHRRRRHPARMGRRHPLLRRLPCRAAQGGALHGRAVRAGARRRRTRRRRRRRLQSGRIPGAEGDGQHRAGGSVSGERRPCKRSSAGCRTRSSFRAGSSAPRSSRLLASSPRLTGADGLAIYQRGYFLRIASCMREQFPALCHALGEELFDDFVADYIRDHAAGEPHALRSRPALPGLARGEPAGSGPGAGRARDLDRLHGRSRPLRAPGLRDVRRARARGQAVRRRRHAR